MDNKDMWYQLIERHGWSEDDVVKLKASGIKALIDQAYLEGFSNGLSKNNKEPDDNIFGSFFGGIFDV